MDRILVCVCALGLLAGSAPAQERWLEPEPWRERTTLAEDSLAGPVYSVWVQRPFTAAGRNGGRPWQYVQFVIATYDMEGRRTKYAVVDSGVVTAGTMYAYDGRGRSTEHVRFTRRGEVGRVRFEYGAGGGLVGRETTGEIPGRERYLRDEAGRLVEVVDLNGARTTYRYDAQGRRVERVGSLGDGTVLGTTTWEHGPAGVVRETRIDGGGLVRYVFDLRHDAEGRLVERTIREENAVGGLASTHSPVPGRETFSYRDGGRTVETESFAPDGVPRGRKLERFDARGRIVERQRFGPDGAPEPAETFRLDGAGNGRATIRGVERWSYEDDRHGNWTRRRWLIVPQGGGQPVETYVETRAITYQ